MFLIFVVPVIAEKANRFLIYVIGPLLGMLFVENLKKDLNNKATKRRDNKTI